MVQSGTIYARLYGMCNVEAEERLALDDLAFSCMASVAPIC